MTPGKVIGCARQYLGVPFRHQGRTPYGLDCAGVIVRAFSDAGMPIHDVSGYGRLPQPAYMKDALERTFVVTDRASAEAGDVLWLVFDKDPTHIGIYTGHTLIHGFLRSRRVVEHRMDVAWWSRLHAVYRHQDWYRV